MENATDAPGSIAKPAPAQHGILQFIKFCIVGGSSTIIDVGTSTILFKHFGWPWFLAKMLSFCLGVTNGFFWNQRWTFQAKGHRPSHDQYIRFFAVNIVGLMLNLMIMGTVFRLRVGTWNPDKRHIDTWYLATAIATCIVVFWNYNMNKRWTFKHPDEPLGPLTA